MLPFVHAVIGFIPKYVGDLIAFHAGISVPTASTVPGPVKFKDTFVGWTLGAGIEHAMTDNLILRAEYRRNDFGRKTFEIAGEKHEVELTSDEWKFGAAYKF
ncbi:outer membrane protein [Leptospira interrogans]